jgi:DNA polymerase I
MFLVHEGIETYDASYYETQLIKAVESVLSPLGWDQSDIRRELSGERDAVLSSFGASSELS